MLRLQWVRALQRRSLLLLLLQHVLLLLLVRRLLLLLFWLLLRRRGRRRCRRRHLRVRLRLSCHWRPGAGHLALVAGLSAVAHGSLASVLVRRAACQVPGGGGSGYC